VGGLKQAHRRDTEQTMIDLQGISTNWVKNQSPPSGFQDFWLWYVSQLPAWESCKILPVEGGVCRSIISFIFAPI
jgi:hypothetical protein